MKARMLLGAVFLWATATVFADTVYLKNGKSLEGLITKEDKNAVEINVGGGTVVFQAGEIARVERSTAGEIAAIKKDWALEKVRSEQAKESDLKAKEKASAKWEALVEEERREGEARRLAEENTKIVPVIPDGRGHFFVKALLNGDVPALLMIDTGCPTVLLTARMGQKLGIDMDPDQFAREVMVLDGKHRVRGVVLKNVKLEEVENKNILADVMLDDSPNITRELKDGLLGMSFLGKYNVTLDQKKMKLIFKPRL